MLECKVKKKYIAEEWLTLLNDCLPYEVANVRLAAVTALPVLLSEYYPNPDSSEIKEIVEKYVNEMSMEAKQSSRMGHALALGSLPKHVLRSHFQFVTEALIDASKISVATAKWAEGRRDAIKGLTSVVSTMADEIGNS